jgi:hypothetical protein
MTRTIVTLAAFLQIASVAGAQNTATFTVSGPNGEPIVIQGTVDGVGIGAGVGPTGPNGPVRDNRPQTGTGRVRGRITTDTGQPLRRAPIRLNGAPSQHVTTTDIDGRYEFTDLPSGHFTVLASRTGYIATNSDAFDLADNERRDNVNIRVPRGGVITGQVTDEFGEPVVGAAVVPMRSQFVQGQRRLTASGASAMTNDIGEYRLFGLTPGDYYVSVSPRNESVTVAIAQNAGAPPVTTQSSSETGYAPTYFPGTSDAALAQRLTLAASQQLGNINISLLAVRLAKVSGIALDADGRFITRGNVAVMPYNSAVAGGGLIPGGSLRPDGSFSVPNVPPGEYLARATLVSGPPAPGAPVPPPLFSVAIFTVTGDDVTGLVLTPIKPATLRGRVVFDDSAAAAGVKPSTARVTAQRIGLTGLPLVGNAVGSAPLKDDFTFEVTAAPEASIIRAAVPVTNQQVPWRLKAVRIQGVDVVDTGVELKPGETVDDIEIEMTNRQQVISGQVLDAAGQPAKDFSVILFSQDRSRWTNATNRYWAVATPQAQGGYKMSSLPPGDYYALAVAQRMNTAEWTDPDFLENAARTAVRFSLQEGDTRTLDLKLPR